MLVIWKYNLEEGVENQKLFIPDDAQFLSVQLQHGKITVWMLVNPENVHNLVIFDVLPTGGPPRPFAPDYIDYYRGTVQMSSGLVWHIFVQDL